MVATPAVAQSLPDRIAGADTVEKRIELAKSFVEETVLWRTPSPGFSVAVYADGKVVWSQSFGEADVENAIPVTNETQFGIGSVSKLLAAAAVLKLVDSGKLDLDAKIQTYVPEFPEREEGLITVRMLAGHLGGIRHYNPGEPHALGEGGTHFEDVASTLRLFKDDPLVTDPGTQSLYSSFGWSLISLAVERAAEQDFLGYVSENVCRPLGMPHTVPDDVTKEIPGRASRYIGDRGKLRKESPLFDKSFVWAAGGFLSTPEDLLRLGRAFMEGEFFKPSTRSMALTQQKATGGEDTMFGIGWCVDETRSGVKVACHGGTTSGGHSVLLVRPDQGIVVAFAGNHESGASEDIANVIASIFSGDPEDLELVGATARRKQKDDSKRALIGRFDEIKGLLGRGDVDSVIPLISDGFASSLWEDKKSLENALRAILMSTPVKFDESSASARYGGWTIGAVAGLHEVRVTGGGWPERMMAIRFRLEADGWRLFSWE